MRLAIADPPYPPQISERRDLADGSARTVVRSRARRYYGDGARSSDEKPADFHPAAAEWDNPARHRALIEQLLEGFDGWAIATTPDGIEHYRPLPIPARLMAWVKPNGMPGGHRLRSTWEAVIVYVPEDRRRRAPGAVFPDSLVAAPPAIGFIGAKPAAWTRWVLDALGYDPAADEVVDLFPGSGAVSRVLRQVSAS